MKNMPKKLHKAKPQSEQPPYAKLRGFADAARRVFEEERLMRQPITQKRPN